jgi:hypothetical protein
MYSYGSKGMNLNYNLLEEAKGSQKHHASADTFDEFNEVKEPEKIL